MENTKATVDKIVEIVKSDKFKEAERLMKMVAKLKDTVKKFCQDNELKVIITDKSKLEFKTRTAQRLDPKKIPVDLIETCYTDTETWLSYYESRTNN